MWALTGKVTRPLGSARVRLNTDRRLRNPLCAAEVRRDPPGLLYKTAVSVGPQDSGDVTLAGANGKGRGRGSAARVTARSN